MTDLAKLKAANLTGSRLRELLRYDPLTGLWTWLVTRSRNARFGTLAGTVHKTKKSLTPYLRIKIDGRSYLAHRLAFLYMTDAWPLNQPDHRNTDGLDNRWENLRDATQSQNQANRGVRKDNQCGIKGVFYCERDKKFGAEIQFDGEQIRLGHFNEVGLAALAYETAANKLFGEFARVE